MAYIGGSAAVCNDSVLESTRIFYCGQAASGLPLNSCNPSLEEMQEGPTRQHPLIGGVAWALFPEE
jgi:hypothetical protein